MMLHARGFYASCDHPMSLEVAAGYTRQHRPLRPYTTSRSPTDPMHMFSAVGINFRVNGAYEGIGKHS